MTHHSASSDLNTYAIASPAPARRWAKRSKFTKSAAALAVVLMAGAGTVAVAQAATPPAPPTAPRPPPRAALPAIVEAIPVRGGMWGNRTPPAAAGTVASVGTGTFTLNARDGTSVTVDVTSSTTYKDPKVTSPSFADVTVGEMVSVQGTTASGVVTATSVLIGFGWPGGLFGPGTPPAAAGTVESVGTDSTGSTSSP